MSMIALASCENLKLKPILHESWRLSSGKLTNRGVQFDAPSFGRRLKEAFKGAKNAQIAKKLGVSESAVSNYVGGRVPDAETLVKIKSITNCDLDWLLTGAEDKGWVMESRGPVVEDVLVRRIREIVHEELYSQLKVQDLGAVDEFDIESAVKKYDNALPVLREWYAHDKLRVELPQALDFHGWDEMTLEQKVQQVRGARQTIDHNRYLKERRETTHKPEHSK